MIPKELDETDIKIINALKKNGRISMTDLGRQVYDIDQELIRIESELNDLRKEGKDEKATQESRDAVEQRMRYVKNDRDRRERERDALLSRARERGYSNVW